MATVNKNFVIKNGLEVDTSTLVVDATNNRVGIGTTNPQDILDVYGSGTFNSTYKSIFSGDSGRSVEIGIGNTSDIAYIDLHTADDTAYSDYSARIEKGAGATGALAFINRGTGSTIIQNYSTQQFIVTSSGDVGITTLIPDSKLTIDVDALKRVSVGFGTEATITYRTGSGAWFHAGKSGAGDFFEISNGSTVGLNSNFVITNTNNIGIGVTNPGVKLQIGSSTTTDSSYFRVGGFGGPSKYYRTIPVPAKATASGTLDSASNLYVGRFYNGATKLHLYSMGWGTEEGVDITVHRMWGTSAVPVIASCVGYLSEEIISFHYEIIDNETWDLYIQYNYNAAAPQGIANRLNIDISNISWGNFYIPSPLPTTPTLDASNRMLIGLYVSETGQIGIGNNRNPQGIQFDGFGIMRMSSGASYQSQIISRNDSNDTTAGYFILEKSRSGTAIQDGDTLGTLLWRGFDSNNSQQNSTASIYALAEGTIGAGAIPAGMYFNASSKFTFNNTSGEILRISGTGNVGIGTTNPAFAKLHSYGTVDGAFYHFTQNDNTGTNAFSANSIRCGTAQAWWWINSDNRATDGGAFTSTIRNDSGSLRLQALSNEGIFIKSGGNNIGIGTDNPQYRLHIIQNGDSLALETTDTTGRSTLKFLTNGNDWELGARSQTESLPDTFYIFDNAASAHRFVIRSTGYIGIGTTNPDRQLHISADGESNIVLENKNAGTDLKKSRIYHTSTNEFILSFVNDAFDDERAFLMAKRSSGINIDQLLLNQTGGNVGIGTTNAIVKLDVGGEASQFPATIRIRNTAHATSKRAAIAFGNGLSHQILIDTQGNGAENFGIYQANINKNPFIMHQTTGFVGIGGELNPPSELAVYGYITENPGDGTYYNVVTQRDVGFNPNQIPLNQYLGQLAFMDEYSPTEIINPSQTTAQLTIAQSRTSGYAFIQLGKSATATNNFHLGSEGNGYFNIWGGNWGFGSGPLFTISSNGNVGINTSVPTYKLQVNGSFAATTKSFVIDHPTKPGFKLRYGSLEGPENGVYIRGRISGNNTIELPEYWTELVDEDSITVNLTPIGRNPGIHSVIDISNNSIVIESSNGVINCFFTVFAEREDVDKLVIEYES